jgi:hypothetical protein
LETVKDREKILKQKERTRPVDEMKERKKQQKREHKILVGKTQ